MTFKNIRSFLTSLEEHEDLLRIKTEVDPEYEVTEIAMRAVKRDGPALLFEKVRGSSYPLVINLFGAARRIEWALGRPPGQIGEELVRLAENLNPPRLSGLWSSRKMLGRVTSMRLKETSQARVKEVSEVPNLEQLPILKCWPEDGGRFITFPLVLTQDPVDGKRNLGIYRMQVFNNNLTGMHWQIQKGGGFHHAHAKSQNKNLPLAAILGGDPILLLAGILPLPEGFDEMIFAGLLRGEPTRVTRLPNGLLVPAEADFVLEGYVPPDETREEGPFGDHFGHYSEKSLIPVFHVEKIWRRSDPIYPAAVVGKPPQEDKYMGEAVQEMLLPLIKLMRPELVDLWAYYEAGFHNLAVASVRQRYQKESIKTALALLGEGQMSLTKVVILVDPDVHVRDFKAVLRAVREHFDPQEDFILFPRTAQDTLDFTGHAMNLGSKMILDATSYGGHPVPQRNQGALPLKWDDRIIRSTVLESCLLVVQVKRDGRQVVEDLVRYSQLSGYKIIAAVSSDVPLDDRELLIWGIFTRFDCSRDLVFRESKFVGVRPVYSGPMGIDATWKEGYPKSLEMNSEIIKKVDRKWEAYGFEI